MVNAMVNRERLAETFKTLVGIDSISREEGAVSHEIRKIVESLGAEVFIDDSGRQTGSDTGNLIAKFEGDKAVPPLLLNAHMDTVAPGKGVVAEFKDGVFKSGGNTVLGADDKSAVAIIIETLRVLRENAVSHGPLEVVFTICEEIGLLGAKHLDYRLLSAPYGYALDTADTETVITRAPAANRFDLTVHGKSAHAGADPEKGINAIALASQAIASVELGRIDEETTCNIGFIDCPGATNVVPDRVRVKGEVRSHDTEKLAQVTENIVGTFERVVETCPERDDVTGLPSISVDIENEFPKTEIAETHPVVRLAHQAARNLGREMSVKKTGGGSDANIFFSKGIVTGVIGTGMRDIHTVREWIRLADMVGTVELLLEIIGCHASETDAS
ncbi:MAG: M20/M25/M40 family metallo-hydrolase [Thermodesulfobacteriota bacterium]